MILAIVQLSYDHHAVTYASPYLQHLASSYNNYYGQMKEEAANDLKVGT